MSYSVVNLARIILLVSFGSVLVACGEAGTSEPYSLSLVYCDNPEASALSCSLPGYSMANDSALRAKLEGCATASCHGASGLPATSWTIDLSGSVGAALSALRVRADGSNYFLVDDADPDCSQLLSEVSERTIGGVRMPVVGGFWSAEEIDCFRSYLHEMSN
jgi:hypothetical protein